MQRVPVSVSKADRKDTGLPSRSEWGDLHRVRVLVIESLFSHSMVGIALSVVSEDDPTFIVNKI